MNNRFSLWLLIGSLATFQIRSQESWSNGQTNTESRRRQILARFPTTEAKRLALSLLRGAKKPNSGSEGRRLARAYLCLFLPETAMDQLRSEGNQSANEQSLNMVVEAEALRQVFAFGGRSLDLQVELTKMKYTNPTNFESVANWLVAETKVDEGSAKAPAVVGIEVSRAWLEKIWLDEDGVDKLIALKTALEWMQVSLAGCAEVTTVVKPVANGKISCHITLAGILAVGQAPKTIDCDSLSNFLSSTKKLWTTKGKDRELRKLLENILIETHLGLIE